MICSERLPHTFFSGRDWSGGWLRLGGRRLAVPKDPRFGPPAFEIGPNLHDILRTEKVVPHPSIFTNAVFNMLVPRESSGRATTVVRLVFSLRCYLRWF